MHSRATRVAVGFVAAFSLAAAACGSDDDAGESAATTGAAATTVAGSAGEQTTVAGSTDGATDPGLETATAYIQDFLEPPTSFAMAEYPLSAKPEPKAVGFVVCPDPSCVRLAEYVKDATDALGWDLIEVTVKDWSDPGSAIQQLIDQDVDYVGLTGFNIETFQAQMDEMKSKGIKLFQAYSTDVPAGDANNLYANPYDASGAAVYGAVMTNWIIDDSAGEANVLIVSLGTTPILDAQVAAAEKVFAENCPGCVTDVISGSQNDLATGGMPQLVVSYLQTHQDVNYVFYIYNSLETGSVSAMKSAGVFDRVKIVGTQGQSEQMQEIIDGTSAAWTALPLEFSMWAMVDQMARVATGDWKSELEREAAVPPMFIVTAPAQAEPIVDLPGGWPGPDGFKETFMELWGV